MSSGLCGVYPTENPAASHVPPGLVIFLRVFKTTYKDRKGRAKGATAWYFEFRDHMDTVGRLPPLPSKAASEAMGRGLEKLVAYHKESGGQCDPA